jgi:hypothetical protein
MPSSVSATFERWNRKAHYYLGLYLLFFLWLFLFTGLMLNHERWSWVSAANERRESRREQSILAPSGETDAARAGDFMRQLHLTGELELPAAPQTAGVFTFNVARPNDSSQVRVDLIQNTALVRHFDNSTLAIIRIFHVFSGSRFSAPSTGRDWALTTIWVTAMDLVAAGLVVMVLGSYYMWFRLKRVHTLGWVCLLGGCGSCAVFVIGLFSG